MVLIVLCLETQMERSGWLRNDSLLTYKRPDQEDLFTTLRATNASCNGVNSVLALKEFFDQELNDYEDNEKFNYCQWDTNDRAILTTFPATYEEYKETLINIIDDLTRHSYIAKLKITSS